MRSRDGKDMTSMQVRYYQPATFGLNWRYLYKSKHVLNDRFDKWKALDKDSEIIMVWKEINKPNYILFLDTGDRLITTEDMIITIITKEMHLSHKYVILWDTPFIRIGEEWFDNVEEV